MNVFPVPVPRQTIVFLSRALSSNSTWKGRAVNPASTSLSFGWVSVSVPETEELEALSSLSIVTNFFNLPEGIKTSVTSVGRRQDKSLSTSIKEGSAAIRFSTAKGQRIRGSLYMCNTFHSGHTHNSFFVDLKTE